MARLLAAAIASLLACCSLTLTQPASAAADATALLVGKVNVIEATSARGAVGFTGQAVDGMPVRGGGTLQLVGTETSGGTFRATALLIGYAASYGEAKVRGRVRVQLDAPRELDAGRFELTLTPAEAAQITGDVQEGTGIRSVGSRSTYSSAAAAKATLIGSLTAVDATRATGGVALVGADGASRIAGGGSLTLVGERTEAGAFEVSTIRIRYATAYAGEPSRGKLAVRLDKVRRVERGTFTLKLTAGEAAQLTGDVQEGTGI